jgi:hypothetical protein
MRHLQQVDVRGKGVSSVYVVLNIKIQGEDLLATEAKA